MCIRDSYFVSGRALKPLRSFASQVEQVQLNNLADMRIDEDVLPEFRQLSHSLSLIHIYSPHRRSPC